MRSSAIATGALALLVAVLLGVEGAPPSVATSPPSAQRFSIDMDPSGTPANTATSLGSREVCARMNENNFLDGDEDFVDTVEFDVTATGIPTANAMTAYAYTLNYPAPNTQIVYHQPMMIGQGPVPQVDPLPDTDGSFNVAVADPSGPAESGSGVLDRLRIETRFTAPGVSPLTLSNAAHVDTNGNAWAPDALDGALLRLNSSGCPTLVDIEMVSLSLASANPVPYDWPSTVTVSESIRNNGPSSVNTSAQTTFTVPSGCTLNGAGGTVVLNAGLGVISAGSTVPHPETPSLLCTSAGPQQVPVTACGLVNDPSAVDPISGNNCKTETLSFTVGPPDTDHDGYTDDVEAGTPLCGDGRNEDGVIVGGASDDPTVDDGCPGGPPQEGSYSEAQFNIGTSPTDACGTDGNPADLNGAGMSANRVDFFDLTAFLAPGRRLDTSPGHVNYSKRVDLVPGRGPFNTWINITDITSILMVKPLASPWNGNRAFGGPACGGIPPF